MRKTPSALRLHIGIFGRRNVGKSSLMNRLSGKETSIVSETPGTTTDPVQKSMELESLGPVVLVDTAGIDDLESLGKERVKAARKVIQSTDLAILTVEPGIWGEFEDRLAQEFGENNIPMVIAVNKVDKTQPDNDWLKEISHGTISVEPVSAITGEGMDDLLWRLVETAPDEWINSPPVLVDLIKPDDVVIQVMPIDIEAPLGRILLPQVQAVRDVIDGEGISIVVKETELQDALDALDGDPDLVVTDSQAFALVSRLTPPQVAMTSYSTLYARCKGDLPSYIRGARAVDFLKDGDKILVAEACVHHPIGNDIGRIQIPAKMQKYTGKKLEFDFVQGKDFPADLTPYKLVVHCGACVFNRKQTLYRIRNVQKQGVPVSNYGVTLATLAGVLPRAIKPFFKIYPDLKELFN